MGRHLLYACGRLFAIAVREHLDPIATNYRASLETNIRLVVGVDPVTHRYAACCLVVELVQRLDELLECSLVW